jgi:hypothetical protein
MLDLADDLHLAEVRGAEDFDPGEQPVAPHQVIRVFVGWFEHVVLRHEELQLQPVREVPAKERWD